MSNSLSPGAKFRQALVNNKPLQVVGTINAYCAMMAEQLGHQAIYLSGGGVANASYGLPDLGMTSLNDVIADVQRITSASSLPLLVDIDTGWGGAFNIAKTIRDMEKAGAAAVHIEDQVAQKRCGHRPNKAIVTQQEMVDRIKAAADAKIDSGADGIFAEAIKTEEHYRAFTEALDIPVLANITEFGQTELWNKAQLGEWGCAMVLYPLSAFRAMNKAAESVYKTLLEDGDQKAQIDNMQTRMDLYDYLGYHDYEQKLDVLFSEGKNK